MPAAYLALFVFVVVALLVPASLLLSSILLRIRKRQNSVSGLNFESGEQSTGAPTGIMHEYFHYFTGFLAFEVVAAIFVLWVYVNGFLSSVSNAYVLGFMVASLIMEYAVILLAMRYIK
ncbi:MAG: NADH-quinone oxidoreductase subunit A [Candidatus Marsarchaeota archaeon]|nr:NADH-quinone oxidoreductase subunit A [Candidatus Marsarchaeota archaeon]